ncbi:50S ribosomal protein L11 methyltransferase [Bacteroidota bacterium]
MSHKEMTLRFPDNRKYDWDIIISQLSVLGFNSFWEDENRLVAYIENENLEIDIIQSFVKENLSDEIIMEIDNVKDQNWNALWESNFDPIELRDACYIHAPFHPEKIGFKHDLIIDPQMAFGTGHHETTISMIELIMDLDVKGKSVLDMGCGTAVLAILAKKMGSTITWAVDNDEWAVKNSIHNAILNKTENIEIFLGDANFVKNISFDIIFANINRNILLRDISVYNTYLNNSGYLLLSGFYEDDLPLIEAETSKIGLTMKELINNNDWMAVCFAKE